MQIGVSSTIGERLYDVMGKLRVQLGPMATPDYMSLLPGGNRAHMLEWLVRAYGPGYMDYDVELHLEAGSLKPTMPDAGTRSVGVQSRCSCASSDMEKRPRERVDHRTTDQETQGTLHCSPRFGIIKS